MFCSTTITCHNALWLKQLYKMERHKKVCKKQTTFRTCWNSKSIYGNSFLITRLLFQLYPCYFYCRYTNVCHSGTLIHLWSRFSGTRESKPSYGLVGLSIVVHICIMCKYYIPSRHGTCMLFVLLYLMSKTTANVKICARNFLWHYLGYSSTISRWK